MVRLSLLCGSFLLLSSSWSLPLTTASFHSHGHVSSHLRSLHKMKTLATPPISGQFVQFPNGISVNLEGYGTAELPEGFPVQDIPSYDSSTNTVTDPTIAAALAYALSVQANPFFTSTGANPFGDFGNIGIPGLSGVFGDIGGGTTAGGGAVSGNEGTGGTIVLPATGAGTASFPTAVISPVFSSSGVVVGFEGSTGVAGAATGSTTPKTGTGTATTNPSGGTTSGTSPGGSSQGGGNTPASGSTVQNGAAMVAASFTMVVGLAAATMMATWL